MTLKRRAEPLMRSRSGVLVRMCPVLYKNYREGQSHVRINFQSAVLLLHTIRHVIAQGLHVVVGLCFSMNLCSEPMFTDSSKIIEITLFKHSAIEVCIRLFAKHESATISRIFQYYKCNRQHCKESVKKVTLTDRANQLIVIPKHHQFPICTWATQSSWQNSGISQLHTISVSVIRFQTNPKTKIDFFASCCNFAPCAGLALRNKYVYNTGRVWPEI